jgi:hypothetical protein
VQDGRFDWLTDATVRSFKGRKEGGKLLQDILGVDVALPRLEEHDSYRALSHEPATRVGLEVGPRQLLVPLASVGEVLWRRSRHGLGHALQQREGALLAQCKDGGRREAGICSDALLRVRLLCGVIVAAAGPVHMALALAGWHMQTLAGREGTCTHQRRVCLCHLL